MNVTDARLQSAVGTLRAFGARRIVIFGSVIERPDRARDVDLAVEGIPLNRLLDADVAVSEIFDGLADLVSREENPALYEIARDYGRVLYEER